MTAAVDVVLPRAELTSEVARQGVQLRWFGAVAGGLRGVQLAMSRCCSSCRSGATAGFGDQIRVAAA